ncbi:uncharacterized protein MONBRDRAFT_38583 [Monosiga brevicollis MX1]|uniref:AMP-dependent synthetase/ligase domain-containing protein n=1 Tax=Monosiga brevicollis TaxID=81824 RepID=A9V8W8_MONBE|nr:uncharacterized protein MONBRDRAFT_38583 [Monosiga brevicollis MX1]EDQ85947.1 predicted protein [Monosiga brevicollis MX1]|eukprot:XP_001749141.1 hypothetical protein [Monosiga brevicollis MX1]
MESKQLPLGQHYGVDPDTVLDIKTTPDGIASIKPVTVMERFKETVERFGDRDALAVKRDGYWHTWTYRDYHRDIITAAKAFIHFGLDRHHSVGIIGFNSPEWFIADLGAVFAGGFASGIYTTNGPESLQYVADHSRSQFLFVEDRKQLAKIKEVQDQLPTVKLVVMWGEPVEEKDRKDLKIKVIGWDEFMRGGRDVAEHEVHNRMKVQSPGECCTLIYTSGTTGTPKAVMMTHDNITWTAKALSTHARLDDHRQEHIISYLPLSHIAAQILDMHAPILMGAKVWFAQPDALKGSLPTTLAEVRPTIFLGVPRVWEKIEEKMRIVGAQSTGLKKKIATWAKRKGMEASMADQRGERRPSGFGLANKLVFKKIRAKLGLDRCHFLATAAAPISRETLDYFLSLYLPIMEVYGMSENTGPQTVNRSGNHTTGSVGVTMAGLETKIDNPDANGDGEICMRGRHVMKGYLFNEEKTRETIDEDGWLHTGDVGRMDDRGFLFITGRIKEIIITAGGENVAPVPIEDTMKACCPILSNVMVIGDKRKFLSQVVTLKCEVDVESGEPLDKLTDQVIEILSSIGSSATTVSAAREDPKVIEYIDAKRKEANNKSVSRAQNVQKSYILPVDFSVPGGELGPTLKLKRPVVYEKYKDVIDGLYA